MTSKSDGLVRGGDSGVAEEDASERGEVVLDGRQPMYIRLEEMHTRPRCPRSFNEPHGTEKELLGRSRARTWEQPRTGRAPRETQKRSAI